MSLRRCTHVPQRVSQIWQARGGRKTVTKANNRKQKTRTAKTLGVELFLWGKHNPSEGVAVPPTTAVHVTATVERRHSAVLHVVLSPTLLTVNDQKENRKNLALTPSLAWFFKVLRTQRSSVSITISVFKQKGQKVALRRWVFLGLTQPAIHPAWTRVQKCPADPDRRHFVNSPPPPPPPVGKVSRKNKLENDGVLEKMTKVVDREKLLSNSFVLTYTGKN